MKAVYRKPGDKNWNWINITEEEWLSKTQELVEGFVEAAPNLYNNVRIYVNEEGKLRKLEINCFLYDGVDPEDSIEIDLLHGTVVLCGPMDDNEQHADMTQELLDDTEGLFEFIPHD